ncbi:hypothetical protein [Henriciella marina]|uniref:hypothetical protein n=1 Tax=Henriciella marina TaxID=453851 RepID=UPI000381566C|nr:hypothetical protein [Henriciella marina]
MNFKIILLAASALLMGACGGNDQDVAQEVGEEVETPDYVYGEQTDDTEAPDLIEGDGSERPNDNAIVDTRQDTGPANLETEGGIPTPEDDLDTGSTMPMQDGSPETTDETTPQ